MPLTVNLQLSDEDLDYYRGAMDEAWQRNAQRPENELLEGVRQLLRKARRAEAPEYVRKRLDDLDALVSMLQDAEWPLEEQERKRIVVAVSYFADPQDMIPDQIPGLGFLDDALMAELVIRELQHELDGYREFCEYRENEETLRGKSHVSRADWLAAKRRQVFMRIKRRQEESRRHASTEGPTVRSSATGTRFGVGAPVESRGQGAPDSPSISLSASSQSSSSYPGANPRCSAL